jgi:hypothetical protein
MKSRSLQSALKLGALSAAAVAVMLGSAGSAMADPVLTIIASDNDPERTGDAGGTSYAAPANSMNGPGLPSVAGGWPTGPGMAPDPSFGNSLGTSGFHAAYLSLSEAANVTFQYMGSGNSNTNPGNKFFLDVNLNGVQDAGDFSFEGGRTGACAMLGGLTPTCTAGVNQFTLALPAGLIPFYFQTFAGTVLNNDNNGGNPDTDTGQFAGYFLGVDPYLATGIDQKTGKSVYAGLSDLPAAGDHDYQDLGVRITANNGIPEPGSLALVGVAIMGLMASSRRRKGEVEAPASPMLGAPA